MLVPPKPVLGIQYRGSSVLPYQHHTVNAPSIIAHWSRQYTGICDTARRKSFVARVLVFRLAAGFVVDDGAIERRFSIRSFHGSKAGLPDREDHRPLVPPNSRTVAYQVASVHGTTTTYVQKRGNNTRTVQKQHSLFYEERIICQPPFFLQFEGEAGGLQTVLCTYRTGILDRR